MGGWGDAEKLHNSGHLFHDPPESWEIELRAVLLQDRFGLRSQKVAIFEKNGMVNVFEKLEGALHKSGARCS